MEQNKSVFNKTLILETKKTRIFDNTYIIIIVLIIGLMMIVYAFYYYTNKNLPNVKSSSTYYGKDLAFYTPLFNNSSTSVEDCIQQCQNDITCDGITYNTETSYCTGTKKGILRNDNANFIAWVKDINNNKKLDTKNIINNVLVGRTISQLIIDNNKFQDPYQIGNYSFSFNITIYDFYKNYGVWRHVLHKGTPIDPNNTLNYQSWETLERDLPDQTIGVWISPFTNNLRIAITTTQQRGSASSSYYNDAFIQKCNPVENSNCYVTDMPNGKYKDMSRLTDGSIPNFNLVRQIEYVDHDLKNIPINKSSTFIINIINNYIEIYINGKIIKTSQLNGTPTFNKFPMYIMNNMTFGGELKNIFYFPITMKLPDVQQIMTLSI